MDLVGPRYLKGSTRLYCFNLIDTSTHAVHIEPIRSKEAVEIVRGIIEAWRQLGLPDCLQMDNEMTFRGSNRHPRSLGLVLRFVLSMGVVVRFIPCAEPWRNGMIEKFNDTFDKRFFRVQKFADFDALKAEAAVFQQFHNERHRYSTQGGRTPQQMQELYSPRPKMRLPSGFDPKVPLQLDEGVISFVEIYSLRWSTGSVGNEVQGRQWFDLQLCRSRSHHPPAYTCSFFKRRRPSPLLLRHAR
ncbi:MAG: DDE-type integrase/transposase/recombinase [Bacteroidetes bacterium]|nr:DDE-type integrase/transposase/recombinase [Bacteroidota bacterium]